MLTSKIPSFAPKSQKKRDKNLTAAGVLPEAEERGPEGSGGVRAPVSRTLPLACRKRNNTEGQEYKTLLHGVDTLTMTIQAEIPEALLERLKVKKQEVQNSSDSCRFMPFGSTKLFSFNLQRTGNKLFPYILRTGDFTVCLSNRGVKSQIPNMQISVGSMSCNNDLENLLASFRRWCLYHLILIQSEKVSRIDLFADIDVDIAKLSLWNQSKMVTKCEKVALYYSNRKITGLQVGAGDVILRIYDKITEMTDKQAGHKEEFFRSKWGKCNHVTRVEFQMRRPAVKSLSPESNAFSDVIAKAGEIWKYLTTKWFRQTQKAVDRLNRKQHLSTTSDFWSHVQTCFDAKNKTSATRERNIKIINIKSLVDQASGVMMTVCAALGHEHTDIFGIFATATDLIKNRIVEVMDEIRFESDFYARFAGAVVTF